jgi:hypothetical protein
MAVLVEGISVIVRRDAIDRSYNGGWPAFRASAPNATLCTDDELARVGFLTPGETESYVTRLEKSGLVFQGQVGAVDLAIVDQQRGLTTPCTWLEFGRFPFRSTGEKISACWLFEDPRIAAGLHMRGTTLTIATPAGWEFEGSLSRRFLFVPTGDDS